MLVIGVVSEDPEKKIELILKKIFSSGGIKSVMLESGRADAATVDGLSLAGVDCLILTLNKDNIHPLYLDVLILEDCSKITRGLVKCVSPETKLIYNADSKELPAFCHPNAISYGMSYNAEATVSSVDDKSDGTSFVFCLQRAVTSIGGNLLYAGEIPVTISGEKAGTDMALAAVACGMLCDVPVLETVKI